MNPENIKAYFSNDAVVCDYARAVFDVGLWRSEKLLIEEFFASSDSLLELGCGAGRISFGLCVLDYQNIIATDFSGAMVEMAQSIFEAAGLKAKAQVADACELPFESESFDGVIFGFNGLMQIPLRERRKKAMSEVFRVLKKGGRFIFTTHERENPANADYWQKEKELWDQNEKIKDLDEFGDIYYTSPHGKIFIHSPLASEIEEDMACVGFTKIFEKKRSEIAFEPQAVKEFSDDCIFRVYQK